MMSPKQQRALLAKPVAYLSRVDRLGDEALETRVVHYLENDCGVETIGDLLELEPAVVRAVDGIAEKSFQHILRALAKIGFVAGVVRVR